MLAFDKPAFYFPLDAKNKEETMDKALLYIGKNITLAEGFEWKPVNKSGRDCFDKCPEDVIKALEPCYEWYLSHG